jgi:hypothetical protein
VHEHFENEGEDDDADCAQRGFEGRAAPVVPEVVVAPGVAGTREQGTGHVGSGGVDVMGVRKGVDTIVQNESEKVSQSRARGHCIVLQLGSEVAVPAMIPVSRLARLIVAQSTVQPQRGRIHM